MPNDAPRNLMTALAAPGEMPSVALMLNDTAGITAWARFGVTLGVVEAGLGWLIGEWWVYGGWTEAERVAIVSAPDWKGPKLSTCRKAATCYKKFPITHRREHVPFSHHSEVAALPPAEAAELLDQAEAIAKETGVAPPRRAIRTAAKKKKRAAKEKDLAVATAAAAKKIGTKVYGVLYSDPPWAFMPYSTETGMDRAADNHYPVLGTDSIRALKVPAAKDCVLFLWATVPMLPEALSVMAAWDFAYKSHFAWAKNRAGTGYWVRNQHELLLIGTRGNVPCPAPGEQYASIISAPVGKHSAKPPAFAEMIEEMFPAAAKLEMFARRPRLGWDVWGNEAGTIAGHLQ